MSVDVPAIAKQTFLIMGKLSALEIDLHSVLVSMNRKGDFNVKLTNHLIGTLKNIKRMTLDVANNIDPIINILETHRAELATKLFQQKQPTGNN